MPLARAPLQWCLHPPSETAGRWRVEAGVDEAGRGCLAGPVFAAAVVWEDGDPERRQRLLADPRMRIVRDSKTLSAKQRERAREFIEAEAAAWAVAAVPAAEIDRINILRASHAAMRLALDRVCLGSKASTDDSSSRTTTGGTGWWVAGGARDVIPEAIVVDGPSFTHAYMPPPEALVAHVTNRAETAAGAQADVAEDDGGGCGGFIPHACVVDGDALLLSIAAAGILAKTHRDAYVTSVLHPRFPQYGWDGNKGYGTAAHVQALRDHGPCVEHRMSFRPCAQTYGERVIS